MLSPRWRKVLRDLVGNKMRTLLVVLSISVGVFAVGMILGTEASLSRDLPRDFGAVNPATAEIYTDNFDQDLVDSVRRVPGVGAAQGTYSLNVRAKLGPDQTKTIGLMLADDHGDRPINKAEPESGAWPPPMREISLERASLAYLGLKVGDTITVEDPSGKLREMKVTGSAHYMNLPPPMFVGQGYGFVSADTFEWLGGSRQYNALQLVMAEDPLNVKHITEVSAEVRKRIEGTGRNVYYTYIPNPPGQYPAQDGVQVIMLLLGVLGVLALGLSGFLVINTVSALITQQIRQIGVMKAVGARKSQIVAMYLTTVLGFGALALVIGIPLGALGAYGFSSYMAQIMNYDIATFVPPLRVIVIQTVVGLAVPVVAATWPVVNGTRISVRQAWSDGFGKGGKPGLVDRLIGRIRFFSRPILLSLRNTFRRKGRLALTLSTLTLGGAIFVSVLSVRESTVVTLDEALNYFNYDVQFSFRQSHRTAQLENALLAQPGVTGAEGVLAASARRKRPDGKEGNNYTLLALPPETKMIKPMLLEGRWLLPDDENAVVVNTALTKDESDLKVGDDLLMKIDGRESSWKVVGVVRGVMTGAIAYANRPYAEQVTRNVGRTSMVWVQTEKMDATARAAFLKRLGSDFERFGLPIQSTEAIADIRSMIQSQFDLIVVFLMVMAVLLAVVGGLGLAGTMSLNVIERTREIGVMRAVGASDGQVQQVFLVEGILIGLFSWLVGGVLALPLGQLMSDGVGTAFIQTPLTYSFSGAGALLWLAIVVILAALASFLPARSASRLSVREVLAYE